jgi:hypothetical protein
VKVEKLDQNKRREKRKVKMEEKEVGIHKCRVYTGIGKCYMYFVCMLPMHCELKLKDSVHWAQVDCVEINTDASNGHNSLEPKPLELGLAQIVSNVIHLHYSGQLARRLHIF